MLRRNTEKRLPEIPEAFSKEDKRGFMGKSCKQMEICWARLPGRRQLPVLGSLPAVFLGMRTTYSK